MEEVLPQHGQSAAPVIDELSSKQHHQDKPSLFRQHRYFINFVVLLAVALGSGATGYAIGRSSDCKATEVIPIDLVVMPTTLPTSSPTLSPSIPGDASIPTSSPTMLAPTSSPTSTKEEDPPLTQNATRTIEAIEWDDGFRLQVSFTSNDAIANFQDTVTVQFTAPLVGWLGIGVSQTSGHNMIGSEVVIAKPNTGTIQKYKLASIYGSGVVEMEQQTLINPSFVQTENTSTLAFTKIANEPGELPFVVLDGTSPWISAYGFSNGFGIHAGHSSFNLQKTDRIEYLGY